MVLPAEVDDTNIRVFFVYSVVDSLPKYFSGQIKRNMNGPRKARRIVCWWIRNAGFAYADALGQAPNLFYIESHQAYLQRK